MEWMVVTEFAPGVGVGLEGLPFLCPGCWAEEAKQDVPTGPLLALWFEFALELLDQEGYAIAGLSADELAKSYEEEPWHAA